ncbi:MAG: 5'-nucleotidase C-terminal domain-containing protein [Chitinophagales bacterium]
MSLIVSFQSCKSYYYLADQQVSYQSIDSLCTADEQMLQVIAPYKRKLGVEMNTMLGLSTVDMPKEQPESLLGNFVADAIFEVAQQKIEDTIDCSVPNYGGLRIPTLAAGQITKGDIFELMPFDNMLVVVELDSSKTMQFFQHVARNGGWPVSKHIKMSIDVLGNMQQLLINDSTLTSRKTYRILTSDYVANGGDKCVFLKEEKQLDLDLFFRDAIIQYIEQQSKKGNMISAELENRISFSKPTTDDDE